MQYFNLLGIVIIPGSDETSENISMSLTPSIPKSSLEAAEETSKDCQTSRDDASKTSFTNHISQLHPKFYQQNHHLYFTPQNSNRHLPFPSFHPSLRNFSNLQQSFNYINKTFMPRFKAADDNKESTAVNVSTASVRGNSEVRASTPRKDEVDKKPTKPRIWCLADVATSGNKAAENNNNISSDGDNSSNSDYKNQAISTMRQISIHQALAQFYHPYFSHLTPARVADKTLFQRSESIDCGLINGNNLARSPMKSGDEKSVNTFQPWLTLNERFNQGQSLNQGRFSQERIISKDSASPASLYQKSSNRSPGSRTATPHSSPDVVKNHQSGRLSPPDVPSIASKSSPSLSNTSSPGSNLNLVLKRRVVVDKTSPCPSERSSLEAASLSPTSASSSSSSLLSSTSGGGSKSLSSSLLFQAPAHLPLSSDVIISAPQSPLVYRKHSPSRDSTFEYWPSGRLMEKSRNTNDWRNTHDWSSIQRVGKHSTFQLKPQRSKMFNRWLGHYGSQLVFVRTSRSRHVWSMYVGRPLFVRVHLQHCLYACLYLQPFLYVWLHLRECYLVSINVILGFVCFVLKTSENKVWFWCNASAASCCYVKLLVSTTSLKVADVVESLKTWGERGVGFEIGIPLVWLVFNYFQNKWKENQTK